MRYRREKKREVNLEDLKSTHKEEGLKDTSVQYYSAPQKVIAMTMMMLRKLDRSHLVN